MAGDQVLAHIEDINKYYIEFVYNKDDERLKMKYKFIKDIYSNVFLSINNGKIQKNLICNDDKSHLFYLDSEVNGNSCHIELDLKLKYKKGERTMRIIQSFRLPLSRRTLELREQVAEYKKLYEKLEKIPSYKDHQRLFFEVERKLREAIGVLHYKENHVTDEQSNEKLFERIASIIEVGVFNSVYHAGFDMATGKPFSPSPTENFAPTLEIKDVDLIKQEILRLQNEIDRRENQGKYFAFWEVLYPMLQKMWSGDDDRSEASTLTQTDIVDVVNMFEQLIRNTGFELKYYEDYEDKECRDAKIYIIEGKYGFPALHDGEGVLVTNCEGRRDNY